MMYAFSENYILPVSHDEVVHGKASLISKMPGSYEDKFAGMRSFMGYMMSHPGKKLNFMGSEFGQFKEWNYKEGIEFFLEKYPLHAKLALMTKELNEFYKNTPALYEIEDSWDGFERLAPNDADRNFLSYVRKDRKGNQIVVLVNFSGVDLHRYTLGIEKGEIQDRLQYRFRPLRRKRRHEKSGSSRRRKRPATGRSIPSASTFPS